jgi:uncharacterized protein YcaQ
MTTTISLQTARRYVLGRQGLWPGRRWRGLRGTEQAMRAMEHLQLDPLVVMARAQDLMLHSRVIDYRPDDWQTLTYRKRRFFDWGGWLAVRPMEELPHWRVLMRRERDHDRWKTFAREHAAAIAEMRRVLHERGTLSNREFTMSTRRRVDSYRGRKDSAVALYYLWRMGEAMVTRRDRFERVYAPTAAVAPAALIRESSDAEADDFLLRKMVAAQGLARFVGLNDMLQRKVSPAELRTWREERVADGDLIEVRVEGWRSPRWAPGADASILAVLEAGRVPPAWKPLDTTTEDEAVFVSPLDPVRGRSEELFDFHYRWEVYTPAAKRKYGYYTLPVLWHDTLVARFDAKLDRPERTLRILGLWLEDEALARDVAFAEAMASGLARFLAFLDAERLDAAGVPQAALRRRFGTVRPSAGDQARSDPRIKTTRVD